MQRERIEASLTDTNSAYLRLRRVMDASAALWFWPVTTSVTPPTREQWIIALEALLGTVSRAEARKGRGLFADASWAELDDAEHNEVTFARMQPVAQVLAEHPWLAVCERIAEREGFFHWELDFAPVFAARGGFDLQLGNPPWVRPTWDDALVLAEDDAWFGLVDKPPVAQVRERRDVVLNDGDTRYLDDRASLAGASAHLGSGVDRPLLAGTQPDLYRCFMDRTWRSMRPSGVVGLIHPESHFTEARAGGLRRQTYQRLRRHWQFSNNTYLFAEISDKTHFGVSVYGQPREPSFLNASSLFHPSVVNRSLDHDGTGPEPGIRDEDDRRDTRPHAGRIARVDESMLDKLAAAPRFGALSFEWTRGWEEDADRKAGFFVGRSAIPDSLEDVILQGPHLSVANPFARQPNENARNRQDTVAWDLETLGERPIPRTNYQRAKPKADYVAGYPRWNGISANTFWRLAWRAMADTSTVRTVHATLLPPGPMHVLGLFSAATESLRDLAIAAGMWASVLTDFFAKVAGKTNLKVEDISRFPHPRDQTLVPELILRALRLNCLTADYAPLWEELFDPAWRHDSWTRETPSAPLGDVTPQWTMTTPLRRDAERRQALVEIDALAAVMLGITAGELCAIYRTQFGVLRKYERVMQFDANGRQVPKEVLKDVERFGSRADLGRYEMPFTGADREAEMTLAHADFTRRMAGRCRPPQ